MIQENIPLAVTYILVWLFIASAFTYAGWLKLKADREQCNKCIYKYVCKGICINPSKGLG